MTSATSNHSPAITTVAQALEIARDGPEGAQDPTVKCILETALGGIWARIQAQPDSTDSRAMSWQSPLRGDIGIISDLERAIDETKGPNSPATKTYSATYIAMPEKYYDIDGPAEEGYEEYLNTRSCQSSRWSTASVLKILAFSTVVQLFLYLGLNRYSTPAVPEACGLAEQEPFVKVAVPATVVAPLIPSVTGLVKYQATSSAASTSIASLLHVFQVYQPVLTPSGVADGTILSDGSENTTTISATASKTSSCEVLLMDHHFAFSYGLPFVGNYTPPNCKFNRVTMNFTVTAHGRQFDRLGLMYFGDSEVWRTSTAEPTTNGIIWTYVKDMTEYMYFWNSPQTLIFDLGNLIDNTYTGIYNTTLTATFFNSQDTVDEPASLIVPISARKGAEDSASVFMVPSDNATNTITLPKNVNKAIFTISACGQAAEEFWWSNVLQSDVQTFEPVDGTLYGYSPFREVQVLIDGQLAGVQWPYPIIFTGGVVPGLWRPIVGVDAYDLKEHEIDITPWLPVLSDGKTHTFEIRVAGIIDDGKGSGTLTQTVASSWYVTGKIFMWQDDEKSVTKGKAPTILLPPPVITTSSRITQDASSANETLEYTVAVHRQLSISSLVQSQKGSHLETWTQVLDYKNYGLLTAYGAVQLNNQITTGVDQATGSYSYKASYTYPAYANTTYTVFPNGDYNLDAEVVVGKTISTLGGGVFLTGLQPFASIPGAPSLTSGLSGASLSTRQNGTAHYAAVGGIATGFGSTNQVFTFTGLDANGKATDTELYSRDVAAVNATLVKDVEVLIGKEIVNFEWNGGVLKPQGVVANVSPKQAFGRGPGTAKAPLVQVGG